MFRVLIVLVILCLSCTSASAEISLGNGSSFDSLTVYHGNGSTWDAVTTYRGNGSSWDDISGGGSATCSGSAFYSETSTSSSLELGTTTDFGYVGGVWAGSTFTVCQVDVIIGAWLDYSARNFRVEVWSMSGDTLSTLKGSSDWVVGSNFTYPGPETETFSFTTPVEVVAGDAIVVTEENQTAGTKLLKINYNTTVGTPSIGRGTWKNDGTVYYKLATQSISMSLYAYE